MKLLKRLIIPIFLIFGYGANAQTEISKDSIKSHFLEEVQVTATKTRKEEPITVKTIVVDSIKSGTNSVDPFFIINKQSPSIFSYSDNGSPYSYSYIKMRGLDQTRINFTLNGIPMNEMEDQGIYFSNMPGFIDNIRKVEVQRGVGTSKFGTTSLAGSVNMETGSLIKQRVEAESSYGTFNTFKNSLGYTSGLINETLSFSSNFSHIRTDGFKDNSESSGYTYFGQLGFFDDHDIMKIYGFAGRSTNQMAWLAPTKSQIEDNYKANGNTPEEIDDFGQNFIAANWVNFKDPEVVVTASIYYNNINGYYLTWLDSALMGRFDLVSHQAGGLANVVYDNKQGLNINTGLNYNFYQRQHTLADNASIDDLWYENKGHKQDGIAYVKLNYDLKRTFNTFLDIQYRYVHFSYNKEKSYDWHFVNPKLGFKYHQKNWNIYLSGAMTQREVTRSDLLKGYDDVNYLQNGMFESFGDTFMPNTLPEIVYDVEFGGNWNNKNFNLSANYYMMYFNNERIAYGEINYIGLSLKKPVDRSIRTGVELDLYYNIPFDKSKFVLGTNFNYSYNRIFKWTDNNGDIHRNTEPYASPMILMNNYIAYNHNNFSIGLDGQFVHRSLVGTTDAGPGGKSTTFYSPAYYQLNGHLAINWKFFRARFNCNNILNHEYFTPGGIQGNEATYYVGALRSFTISVGVRL